MEIGEQIDVECSTLGAPVRFTWRGVVYGVVSTPEPWFGRTAWWLDDRTTPRSARGRRLERQLWRVDALPLTGTGPDGTFDLLHDPVRGWSITEAWDETLDEQLLA